MKKLLSVLGAVGIIGSSATSLVSCDVSAKAVDLYIGDDIKNPLNSDNIKNYTPYGMQTSITSIAYQVLNLIALSEQRPTDSDDQKIIGDANELSIDYFIDHKEGNTFYSSSKAEVLDEFASEYRSGGNSRFSEFHFGNGFNQYDSEKSKTTTDKMNILVATKNDDGTEQYNTETLSEFKESLGDLDDFKDLIEHINEFNSTTIPYGTIPEFKYHEVKVDPENTDATKDQLPDWGAYTDESTFNVGFTETTNDDGKIVVGTPASSARSVYQEVENNIKFKTVFEASDGNKYDLDITIPQINVIYSLAYITDAATDSANSRYDAAAFLTPTAYSFSTNKDFTSNDVYKSIFENKENFKVEVSKEQN